MVTLALLALPLGAELTPREQERREAEVLAVYEQAVELARQCGYEISVEISSFSHAQSDEFAGTSYRELGLSKYPARALHLNLESIETPRLRHPRLHIRPTWVENETVPPPSTMTISLAEYFSYMKRHYRAGGMRWQRPDGVAVFQVKVSFGGKQATYPADASWHKEGESYRRVAIDDPGLESIPLELKSEDKLTPFEDRSSLEAWSGLAQQSDYIPLSDSIGAPPSG